MDWTYEEQAVGVTARRKAVNIADGDASVALKLIGGGMDYAVRSFTAANLKDLTETDCLEIQERLMALHDAIQRRVENRQT